MKIGLTPGRLLVVVILLAILAGSIWAGIVAWQSITGEPISLAGRIAMGIGFTATIGLAVLLMGLSFYSARMGIDEQAVYQPNRDIKKGDDV